MLLFINTCGNTRQLGDFGPTDYMTFTQRAGLRAIKQQRNFWVQIGPLLCLCIRFFFFPLVLSFSPPLHIVVVRKGGGGEGGLAVDETRRSLLRLQRKEGKNPCT